MSNKTYQYFILAQSLLAISTSALAEGAFDGASVSAGVGFESLNTKMSSESYIGTYNGQFDKASYGTGNYGTAGNLALTYSQGFSNKFNVAASVFYNVGSNKSGSLFNFINWKIKDAWGLSLEPGYYFTDTTLGYMKLGYAQASSELNLSDVVEFKPIDFGKAHGFLYGAGIKQIIAKNIYLGVDAYQMSFTDSKTIDFEGSFYTNNPAVTYGGVSLGYIFNEADSPSSSDRAPLHDHAFDGMNVQLSVGGVAINNNFAQNVYKFGETDSLAYASIGYSAALANRLNLSSNIFYGFGSFKSGYFYDANIKTNDVWGVAFEPGYYFTNNTLGYAKVGYARSTTKVPQLKSFPSADGILYGLGLKQLLTDKIYLGVEAYRINFKATSNVLFEGDEAINNETSLTYGGLLVGYKF